VFPPAIAQQRLPSRTFAPLAEECKWAAELESVSRPASQSQNWNNGSGATPDARWPRAMVWQKMTSPRRRMDTRWLEASWIPEAVGRVASLSRRVSGTGSQHHFDKFGPRSAIAIEHPRAQWAARMLAIGLKGSTPHLLRTAPRLRTDALGRIARVLGCCRDIRPRQCVSVSSSPETMENVKRGGCS